ncbi:hypothetical protein SODG_002600 [Sodalis praecaptivus]
MEKNMMGLLLSLIVAVAAFNIITSLGLLVMEKQAEVAILQTQGLTRRQVMLVFIAQGPAPALSARCWAPASACCWPVN